jgi:hypothetical protein
LLRTGLTPISGVMRRLLTGYAVEFKRLGISQPTASQSVKRGEKVVKEKELKLMG